PSGGAPGNAQATPATPAPPAAPPAGPGAAASAPAPAPGSITAPAASAAAPAPASSGDAGHPQQTSAGYRNIDEFVVTYQRSADGTRYAAIFHRFGLFSWKLSAIDLHA
ncbi:hypothetical protein OIV57_33490, partial [Burkholderia pseudomallei]|nr:hypothetical protein [Burkholderia pseudomallei]